MYSLSDQDLDIQARARLFADELIPLLPALEARGAFAMRRGAYADAVTAYGAALAAYPNDPRALAGLTAARASQGRGP